MVVVQEIVSELQDTAFPEGITLLSLATHTSGLRRVPTNLPDMPWLLNPYANYTDSNLLAFLASYTAPPPPPGPTAFVYSSSAAACLGAALELTCRCPAHVSSCEHMEKCTSDCSVAPGLHQEASRIDSCTRACVKSDQPTAQ